MSVDLSSLTDDELERGRLEHKDDFEWMSGYYRECSCWSKRGQRWCAESVTDAVLEVWEEMDRKITTPACASEEDL